MSAWLWLTSVVAAGSALGVYIALAAYDVTCAQVARLARRRQLRRDFATMQRKTKEFAASMRERKEERRASQPEGGADTALPKR